MSLTGQLLKSSLLCGLKPGENTVRRFKLFFVANKELGSKSHENDFQRALETGVIKDKYWENCPGKILEKKGTGEYRITKKGYEKAIASFPEIKPKNFPNRFNLEGYIDDAKILIKTQDNKRSIFLNDEPYSSNIDNNFKLSWDL